MIVHVHKLWLFYFDDHFRIYDCNMVMIDKITNADGCCVDYNAQSYMHTAVYINALLTLHGIKLGQSVVCPG